MQQQQSDEEKLSIRDRIALIRVQTCLHVEISSLLFMLNVKKRKSELSKPEGLFI